MKVIDLLFTHLGAIAGFGLAVFVVLKLLRQRHRPSVTLSWLLGMAVLPWVVAPLYLLLGGRKLRRAVERATRLAGPRRDAADDDESRAGTVPAAGLQRLLARDGLPPAREGNGFEFLGDGETAHARLIAMIEGARTSIHVTTFILARDDVARACVRLLADKAAEGVEVRLLVDALGSFLSRGRFLDPLREAGGRVASFMPMLPLSRRSSANLRNHRKLVVVDGEAAWVAGMNLAGEYLGSSPGSGGDERPPPRSGRFPDVWLDTAAVLRGPVAADVEAVFASDWVFATGEELPPPPRPDPLPDGDLVAQVVPSGPDVPSDGVADVVLSGIADARRRIWLVTPYFVPDDTLLRSLALQARMGRDVRLIVPRRSDHPLVDLARCRFLRELLAAGATVRSVPDRMMHAKLAVFDDKLAVTGSANLDLRSLYLNFEISVLLHSPPAVAEVGAWIERLDEQADDHVPPQAGVLRTWTEDLAVLISPLL